MQEELRLYISVSVRFDGLGVVPPPTKDKRDEVDLRTVTCILPSRPSSASAWRTSRPSSETMSESTLKETMEAAVSGNWSEIRILAARYSNKKRRSVYQTIH